MLTIHGGGARLCDGLTRREVLRLGGLGAFGLTLPQLLRQQARASARPAREEMTAGKAKACIVLFLMGGSRKKCAIMLCMWPISFLLIFLFFIGVIPLVGMYIWSVVSCYQEAERQNQAHGF